MFGLDHYLASFSDGTTLVLVVAVAILLGLRHATDPDHLAAVTTLLASTERRARDAARLGLAWGAGHALTLFALGVPIVLYRAYLPETVQRAAETAIGFLIAGPRRLAAHPLAPGSVPRACARSRRPLARAPALAGDRAPPARAEPNAARCIRRRAPARDRRQRRRRHPPRQHDRRDGARNRCARDPRRVHRCLDDAADDGLRPLARQALARPPRACARHGQPRVRALVRTGSPESAAVLFLVEPDRRPGRIHTKPR